MIGAATRPTRHRDVFVRSKCTSRGEPCLRASSWGKHPCTTGSAPWLTQATYVCCGVHGSELTARMIQASVHRLCGGARRRHGHRPSAAINVGHVHGDKEQGEPKGATRIVAGQGVSGGCSRTAVRISGMPRPLSLAVPFKGPLRSGIAGSIAAGPLSAPVEEQGASKVQ